MRNVSVTILFTLTDKLELGIKSCSSVVFTDELLPSKSGPSDNKQMKQLLDWYESSEQNRSDVSGTVHACSMPINLLSTNITSHLAVVQFLP